MISVPETQSDISVTLPRVPAWAGRSRVETLEETAFLSGTALATLHQLLQHEEVPQALLRQRLALTAAEACVAYSGRSERRGDLRDEVHLLRAGDQPGPAGAVYQQWQRAVSRPISLRQLKSALPERLVEYVPVWLDTGRGAPVTQAAQVLDAVLTGRPQDEATALIMADAVLSRALGWDHVVPLMAGLKRRDLRAGGDDLRLACHKALARSAGDAIKLASDLTRRVHRLRAITPKLRAKGADAAVDMFLSRDAVMPAALPLPDRAARRFCDRLVELGAVRELTGRATYRLYGV